MQGDSFTRRQGPASPWAGAARSACSVCHAGVIWGTARDLVWHVAPSDRLEVFRVIETVGGHADAWRCTNCDQWGVFDSEYGFSN
jgi:hypothetical protein